jgi:hypothetical protein
VVGYLQTHQLLWDWLQVLSFSLSAGLSGYMILPAGSVLADHLQVVPMLDG